MRDFEEHHLLAALVFMRFGQNWDAAREAWTRMLQNPGWDEDDQTKQQFAVLVERGMADFRRNMGLYKL